MLRVTWKKSLAGVVAGLLAVCGSLAQEITLPPGIPQPVPAVPTPIAPTTPLPITLPSVAPPPIPAPVAPLLVIPLPKEESKTPEKLPPPRVAPVAPPLVITLPKEEKTKKEEKLPLPIAAPVAPPLVITLPKEEKTKKEEKLPLPIAAPVAPPLVITLQRDEKGAEKSKKEGKKKDEELPMPSEGPKVVVIQGTGAPTVVYQDGPEDDRRWQIYGGFGLHFVQPYFETNPAYREARSQGIVSTFQQHDFGYTWNVAPEFYLGLKCDSGLGFRVRYWQFAYSATTENVNITANPSADGFSTTIVSPQSLGISAISITPVAGDKFEFTSRLGVLVWDFDVTQDWRIGRLDLTGIAGVRYAHVHHDSSSFFQKGPANTAVGNAFNSFAQNFTGAGPSLGLNATRFIGRTGFGVYGNSRASLLYGTTRSAANRTVANNAGAVTTIQSDRYVHADLLPVGEAEVGLEYNRDIGRIQAMIQCGFTGSIWWGGDNATGSGGAFSSSTNTDFGTNFGFAGLVLRAGFAY